jgi:hypothetical protein
MNAASLRNSFSLCVGHFGMEPASIASQFGTARLDLALAAPFPPLTVPQLIGVRATTAA